MKEVWKICFNNLVYKFVSVLHDETCKEETEQYSWDLAS